MEVVVGQEGQCQSGRMKGKDLVQLISLHP
jgi:hypothetical protein